MQLHVINTGFFKLDGGAMFGVVPKSLWNKTNPADVNNLCTWSMRCLLIEDGRQLILIDNGIGNKQSERFLKHYFLHGNDSLIGSIAKAGFEPAEITDMFHTHLHFDHCGGGIYNDGGLLKPTFANAKYWSHAKHWQWATQPNARERASFLKENLMPIEESEQLHFLDKEQYTFPSFDILCVSGHTESMMIPKIKYKEKTICYMADLMPSTSHIPLPYVASYDTKPLLTLQEKATFLEEAVEHEYILFFEHDALHECCTLKRTEKGVRVDRFFPLAEVL